jgi:hypothetical protein|tara:strand:- start:1941 stop:2072 length:132 start_codon:yes stop_codon:yes gene_type:complete
MSKFLLNELIKKAQAQYRANGKPSNQTVTEMLEALMEIQDDGI